MTHTPGPWEIHQRWPNYHGAEIRAGNISLADLRCNGHNERHGEANARLIAAAPELLDALQKLVAFMADDEPYDDPISATLFDKAINAIAKAIGE